MSDLTIGSMFSGTGMLDAGVQGALGGTVSWYADNDPTVTAVLAHHHPEVPNLGDVTAIDWAAVPPVSILTAGFPCQPVSQAGRRGGTDDERWLFDEVERALRNLEPPPRLCVFENVAGLLTTNRGRAMGRVVHGLARSGYMGSWRTTRSCCVGTPHSRVRVWIVAVPADPDSRTRSGGEHPIRPRHRDRPREAAPCEPSASADRWDPYHPAVRRWERILGRAAPPPTTLNTRNEPRLSVAGTEWMMGLPEGYVTDVPGLTYFERRGILGNGVVPQQAEDAVRELLQ